MTGAPSPAPERAPSCLTGALLAQYQGFADAQMGVGTLVLGLASVIMGQALVRTRSIGISPAGAVMMYV